MRKEPNVGSPWADHLANELKGPRNSILSEERVSSNEVEVVRTDDSLVIHVSQAGGATVAFRAAYTPAADYLSAGLAAMATNANGVPFNGSRIGASA